MKNNGDNKESGKVPIFSRKESDALISEVLALLHSMYSSSSSGTHALFNIACEN